MKPLTLHARRLLFSMAAILCLGLLGTAPAASPSPPVSDLRAQTGGAAPQRTAHDDLSLEKLFPREGNYSPQASQITFSADGRFAAYLYRSFDERYLWSDLWVREMATGKLLRLSPPGTKDRANSNWHKFDYFVWSPTDQELLYVCGGKLYRWKEGETKLTQETAITGFINEVQYLPDGSGYTCLYYGNIRKVTFGKAGSEVVPVQVPVAEKLYWYQLSPDGRGLVYLTYRQGYQKGSSHTVPIATYRGRFVEIRQVNRSVAEDPQNPMEVNVYVGALGSAPGQTAAGRKVFTHVYSGPRDVLSAPTWSPDSGKVAFSVFVQHTGQVRILEAERTSRHDAEMQPAREIYSFRHTGGPTTPGLIQPEYLEDNTRLVFVTEQSGFRHLHVLDPRSKLLEQVTTGTFEVYPLALSPDRGSYYVAATKVNPACRDLYRVSLATGRMERLTQTRGVYGDVQAARSTELIGNVAISPDGRTVLANFSCFGTTGRLVRIDTTSATQETVLDYYPERIQKYTRVRPEFFTYKNRNGQVIHGYMFKPAGWKATDKRPLLIYVYGGPLGIRKMAVEGDTSPDAYYFAYYMAAKHGYVTCVIDPRGSSGYGAEFEKANYEHPGRAQVDDLVDGVRFLVANYGVDPKRVGIHGWSFGGFQTQMCMYTAPDVFTVGIAGAGPTEWENYNAWYSTGTIGQTRTGKPDLAKFSLLPLAKNLKGHLLLVHGMEDDNVFFQDTIKVYRALLQAGKETQVDLFLDPTGNHGLNGDVTYLARFRKYEDFLVRYLGEGRPS